MYFFSSEIRLISDVRGQTILIHVCRSITTLTTSINGGPRVSSNSSISIYSSYTSNLIVSFSCSIFIETLPVPPSWWRSNSCWIWCSCTLFLSSKKFSLQSSNWKNLWNRTLSSLCAFFYSCDLKWCQADTSVFSSITLLFVHTRPQPDGMGNLYARLLGDGLSEAQKAAPFPVQELMTLSVALFPWDKTPFLA